MTDASKIGGASRTQDQDSQNQSYKAQKEQYQSNCKECLTSSLKNDSGKTQLNIPEAIQKIEILGESATDNIKTILTDIIGQLRLAQQNQLTTIKSIEAFLQQMFHEHPSVKSSIHAEAVQAALHSDQKRNPFKVENPFAPKIPKPEKTPESSFQEKPKPKEEEVVIDENFQVSKEGKKDSLLKRIIVFFK